MLAHLTASSLKTYTSDPESDHERRFSQQFRLEQEAEAEAEGVTTQIELVL